MRGDAMTKYAIFAAAVTLSCGMLLAACAGDSDKLVPVDTAALARTPTVPDETRFIVVQRGQSLGRIAELYQVPKQAIIAANHLAPPYRLTAGMRLAIPGAAKPLATERSKGTKEPSAKLARPLAPAGEASLVKAAETRPAKIKEVIPLDDDPPPSPMASQPAAARDGKGGDALRRDYDYFGLHPALSR
jgi:LysM repeat protein